MGDAGPLVKLTGRALWARSRADLVGPPKIMAKSLVVVESPAKAKTINKYLGKDYKVIASMGHVRDLPKSKLGVDVDEDFEPTYEVIASRKKVLKELKDEAKKATDHLHGDRP